MKTVLLQPPDPPSFRVLRDHAGKFGVKIGKGEAILPPLDLAYAASILEKSSYDFQLTDAQALNLSVEDVLGLLEKYRPDLTIVNTALASIDNDLKFSGLVKEVAPNSLVAVTGSMASVRPKIALDKEAIDCVLRNEFDYTVLELARALENGGIRYVKGIVYKKNGKIIKTPDRPLITDLDKLPFPAYRHLPLDRYYYFLLPKKPFVTMLTSRGCPFGCIYCPYPIGYGDKWRARSSENVISEIELVVDDFGVRSILFRDQVFTFDMKRAENICNEIIRKGLDVEWRAETRIDRLSKRLMIRMKKAGCAGLHLGIEAGDPIVLSNLAKKGLSINMIKKIFTEAKEVGIETYAFFMLGLPGETRKSIWNSFKLAREINPNLVQFTVVLPYPGTELYQIAEERGWLVSQNSETPNGFSFSMRTDDLTVEEINKAHYYLTELLVKHQLKYAKEALTKKGLITAVKNPLSAANWICGSFKRKLSKKTENEFKRWALHSC